MNSAIQRLTSLRVADIMAKDVVAVGADQLMTDVANVFSERDISAAPVIDDQGRCVGILSSTDFLKRDRPLEEVQPPGPGVEEQELVAAGEASLEIEPAEDLARHFMTTAVQTISQNASILDAARIMCAEHIHRLIVLDSDQRVTGVISTMDIVAALLNAIDEMEAFSAGEDSQ